MYYRRDDKMTISLRLSEEDSILIKEYASLNKMTVSELVRQSVMEKIENELGKIAPSEVIFSNPLAI